MRARVVLSREADCFDIRLLELEVLAGTLEHPTERSARNAFRAASNLPVLALCQDVSALTEADPPATEEEAREHEVRARVAIAESRAFRQLGNFILARRRAETASEEAIAAGHAPTRAHALYELAWAKDAEGNKTLAMATDEQFASGALSGHDDEGVASS